MTAATVGQVRDAVALLAGRLGLSQAGVQKIRWTPGPLLLRSASRIMRRKVDARQVEANRLLAGLRALVEKGDQR